MINKKVVGVSPHIRTSYTIESTMYDVMIALIPVIIMAMVIYGSRVLVLLSVSVLTGIVTEYFGSKLLKLENQAFDGSGMVTATLLTLTLPVTIPLKVIVIGSASSIFIGKLLFGGVGKNIFNPALVGRLIIMISYPQYTYNYSQVDGEAGASMIPLFKYVGEDLTYEIFGGKLEFYKSLLYGNSQIIRSMGEVSLIAILLGMIYLKLKGHIKLKVPILVIVSLGVTYLFLGDNPVLYSLSGGVMFAAVYMATDMVTSPYTNSGLMLYAILIGVLTVFIRKFTSQFEGVTFAILIANICVPTINKHTLPRSFGGKYDMKKILIFLTAVISVFILSYSVFEIDKIIEKYKLQKEIEIRNENLSYLFGEDVETGDVANNKISDEGYYFQAVNKAEKLIGHTVIFESKGYSTDMAKIMLGLNLAGEIKGLKVLEQNETLGLGSQIQSEEWQNLWKGRDLTYEFDKKIDAYTGATFTFLNAYKEIMAVLDSYEFAFFDEDFDFEEFEDDDDGAWNEKVESENESRDEDAVEDEKTGDA